MRRWVAFMLFAAGLPAQEKPAAEVGRGAFRIYCAPCHGIRAQGGRGPDLTRGTFNSGDTDAELFRVIKDGVPGTEMPSFERVGDDVIRLMVTYIRSSAPVAAPAKVTGDAAAGQRIYASKGCVGCHAIGGQGGRSGPDLTRAGRQRSVAHLRQSISEPDRELAAGFQTVSVTTRDGRKLSGVERGLDNFTVQFTDLSGAFYSFERDELQSFTREGRSLMPKPSLSARELDDLVAYMVTLKGVRP